MEAKEQETKSKKPSFKLNAVLNLAYQILVIAVPFITAPYVSRTLLSAGVGIYSYTHSLVTYFTLVAGLGTLSYGLREVALRREDKAGYSKAFWEIQILTFLTSAFALAGWLVLSLLYSEYKIFLLLLSFQILATCFDISWLYAGLEKFKYTISINAITKILSVVAIFLFVKSPEDTWVYTLIMSLALLAGNLAMWIFLPKTLVKTKIELHSLKKHFKENLIYFVPSIATTIYTVLDKTLIGLLIPGTMTIIDAQGAEVVEKISDVENGYYEQATKILTILKTVCFIAINGVAYSRANYYYGRNEHDEIKKLGGHTLDLNFFLSIPAAFGICAIAPFFVPLFFGPGYDKTVVLIYIMAALVPIIALSNCLGNVYYTPTGRRKESALYLIIGSVINLILNIPLILWLQSYGAAIASLVAEFIITCLYFLRCKRFFTLKDIFIMSYKKIIAGGAMFAGVYFFCHYLQSRLAPIWLTILAIGLGAVIYVVLLLILRDTSIKRAAMMAKSLFSRFGKHPHADPETGEGERNE